VPTLSIGSFTLESGATLPSVSVQYEHWGPAPADGNGTILVCHALTGSAHAAGPADDPGWWQGMIGPGRALDTDRYAVICANFLGGCYGTTGPTTIRAETGMPYGPDFPKVTVRDMVRVQHALLETLGISRLLAVIGGSLGGMQALEWAACYPEDVAAAIPIGCGLAHSAWAIGLNETARRAIMQDPMWQEGRYSAQPAQGLALARMVAMISYRSAPSFESRFGRRLQSGAAPPQFEVESYLHYQGRKLVDRFDANTYLTITHAMDAHDLARNRPPLVEALSRNPVRVLAVGIDSDALYPVAEQREVAAMFPYGTYAEIHSPHGHDGFLIELDQLTALVRQFLGDA
jgi:homoserine O-acetyltransferase